MSDEIKNKIPDDIKREMGIKDDLVEEKEPEWIQSNEPISEIFEQEFSKIEEVKPQVEEVKEVATQALEEVPKKEVKKNSILDRIVVDLDTIEIIEKSGLRQQSDFDLVFNKKAVFQVVAVQSGYSAEMSALTMQDVNNITNSNVDLYTHKKNVYQTVHAHIEKTSIGKIGFTDWLKITSYHDFETLLYGIYCQTFPEKNEFTVQCGSCGKQTTLVVNNETLVETKAEALILEKIIEIINSAKEAADLIGKSLVHTTLRTMLPESKIVVDIQTPSLFDHLELLRTLDQKIIQQYSETIGVMLFIKNMYMLDVESSLSTGHAKYYPIKDKNTMLTTLTMLSMKDGKHLESVINDRIEKYNISYSVKNSKCTHCGDSLGNLPVDIETALFTVISREKQA